MVEQRMVGHFNYGKERSCIFLAGIECTLSFPLQSYQGFQKMFLHNFIDFFVIVFKRSSFGKTLIRDKIWYYERAGGNA